MNIDKIKQSFIALGFEIIHVGKHPSTNGVDMWVRKPGSRPLSVELKVVRKQQNGCFQVDPVQPLRKNDDLVAIECGSYVLIEAMTDHLKCCSTKGTRQMTLLMGTNP